MDIRIQDQFMSRRPQAGCVVHWRAGVPITVADLIRERVLLEIDHDAAAQGRPLLETDAAARDDVTRRERAVALALDGFRRNAFFVVVDDRQLTELEQSIVVTGDTAITFLRLVPLVSG